MSASGQNATTAGTVRAEARRDAFHWPADSARLSVVQAIFAVVMALGFETMVESSYRYFRPDLGFLDGHDFRAPLVSFLPMLAVVALGFRFFWCAVNVRRYVESADFALNQAPDDRAASALRRRLERKVVLLHVPLLIAHSLLFYFGSHLVSDMLSTPSMFVTSITFVVYYSLYQLINVLWLWLLTHDKLAPPAHTPHREIVWMKNNSVISGVGLLVAALAFFGLLGHEIALSIACTVFILGSLTDLTATAYHYLESPED